MNINNAVISKNLKLELSDKKAIYSITPFSLLDYPDKSSCIFWFAGCNMKCGYCYNPEIVFGKGIVSYSEAFSFLKRRVNLLDAVVFSGGECLIHKDIIDVIRAVKELGFCVKIDTNGSKPAILEKLLEQELVDYIALDFKGPKNKFQQIAKLNSYSAFVKSLSLLTNSKIPFEIRTTFHSTLLTKDDIKEMHDLLVKWNYQKKYYIQNFRSYQNTIDVLPESVGLNEKDLTSEMTKIVFR